MQAIYKLHFDCGRSGTVKGIFIAEKEEIDYIVDTKYRVYFGEVLGKHSEVMGPLEKGDYTLISDKPEDVEVVKRLKLEIGSNPVHLWKEDEDEDSSYQQFKNERSSTRQA